MFFDRVLPPSCAELTAAGRAEVEEMNRRSDEAAGAILAPLSAEQRERLVGAMTKVQRLLRASGAARAGEPERSGSALVRSTFLLASIEGEPVACGAVKTVEPGVGSLKRMWVADAARGVKLGRRMLAALEDEARALGLHTLRLETNRALTAAIRLYRSAGYREKPAFNADPYAHHWFEKRLDGPAGAYL